MDVRLYVVLVEILNPRRTGMEYDLRLVEAFSLDDACRQVVIETVGRYGGEGISVNLVFVGPATDRYCEMAARFAEELPLLRMAPVGMRA